MKRKFGTAVVILGLALPAFATGVKGNGQIGSFSISESDGFKRKTLIGDQCVSQIASDLPQSIKEVCSKRCQRAVSVEYNIQSCGQKYTEENPIVALKLGLASGSLFQMSGGSFDFEVSLDCTTGKLTASSMAPIRIQKAGSRDFLEVKTEIMGADQIQTSYDTKTKTFKVKMNDLVSGRVESEEVTAQEGLKSLEYLPLGLELSYVFDESVKNSASESFPIQEASSFSMILSPEFMKANPDLELPKGQNAITLQLKSAADTDFNTMFFDATRSRDLWTLDEAAYKPMMERTSKIDWEGLDAFFTDLVKIQSAQKESKRKINVEFSRYGKNASNAQCMTLP